MNSNSEQLLELVIKTSDDKLAQEIVALDVRQLSALADFFVIMQARNEKQVEAIAQAILEESHKNNIVIKNSDGLDEAKWVLIDLQDVIVHIFLPDERAHYNLEKLWHDAPLYNISQWVTGHELF